jgi:hypothetical protein
MRRLLIQFANFLIRISQDSPWKYPPVYLTKDVVDTTARLVSSYGSSNNPHEGIVYWAGVVSPVAWVVTTAIAPEAKTTSGSYKTSVRANAYVVKSVNNLKLRILAQVHGHPTDWVDHSDGDNRGAFMPYDGFYSVILPWYGLRGMLPMEQCGIHRFEDGRFVRLVPNELRERFTVIPHSIDLRKTKLDHEQ